MAELFDASETAYTATALYLGAITPDVDEVDFAKWGNPEREKINRALEIANLYQWKRRGVI